MVLYFSTKVEYYALAAMASEITWLVALLNDFEVQIETTIVFCDNQAAILLSMNLAFHERSNYIEIDCHFIREKVNSGLLWLVHVQTNY